MMIKIERLERFISLHNTKDRTDPEDDLYCDLMRQVVFDLASELWQDESAAGVFCSIFNPPDWDRKPFEEVE